MQSDNEQFLKTFYQSLGPEPLEADDTEHYVDLYASQDVAYYSPIRALQDTIEWSAESTQLFSGFRGTGKSTELKRLKKELEGRDLRVIYCDMEDYLNLTTPVDISDFLLAIAGAMGEALAAPELLGEDAHKEGYWERFAAFLTRTRLSVPEIGVTAGAKADPLTAGATIKTNLKTDPTFKKQLQDHLAGHLGALVADVHGFIEGCVERLQARRGVAPVVLLLDSIEHIRGTLVNNKEVFDSVETLFHGHAEKLRLPNLHVVYTVPPWLNILVPGIDKLYDGAVQIPCVKVRQRDGQPSAEGLDLLERLVRRRGDWERLLGDRAALNRLLLASGGFLREAFAVLRKCLQRSRRAGLPAKPELLTAVLAEAREQYRFIADDDALWLDKVRENKGINLERLGELHRLARFFDTALVLNYRNGEQWLDLHPLIADDVQKQAAQVRGREWA